MQHKDKDGLLLLTESKDSMQVGTRVTTIGINKGKETQYSVRDNRDRFFYPNEWTKFFDSLLPSQQFTFEFLINTGGRINECRHVKKEDIELAPYPRLQFKVTKIKARKKEKKPKPRPMLISTTFAKKIKKEIKDLADSDCIPILSTPGANIAMKKALKLAGIRDWHMFSVHNIRKTIATWLLALGADGFKVAQYLGHDANTLRTSYASPDVFSFEEKSVMKLIIGDLADKMSSGK